MKEASMRFDTRVLISWVTILIMLFLVVAPSAFATTEEIIEAEEDIWDLYYDGEISVGERDSLLDIIQNKVNINSDEVLELDIITFWRFQVSTRKNIGG